MNRVTRSMQSVLQGHNMLDTKHDHYGDYGYPENLQFHQWWAMYRRSGFAKAGVKQTVLKTWQTNPELRENDEATETDLEEAVREHLGSIRFWQHLMEADKRSLVGGYGGVIFRFADSKRFSEPVDRVPGGLKGLRGVIPAWAGQLTPSSWDDDQDSETYGEVTMYEFNESNVRSDGIRKDRIFQVHPDRVQIWSEDGTTHCESMLEAGFNDLMDLSKISGAGGEGFWKNAKRGLSFDIDPAVELSQMAQSMGVDEKEVADKFGEAVDDFNRGMDSSLLTRGMKVNALPVTLISPEHFHNVSLMGFAASITIPVKILIGSQTGERASTEDANAWNLTNMARRAAIAIPSIREIIDRLTAYGVLPDIKWDIHWTDLMAPDLDQKMDSAVKMADINSKMPETPVYTTDEIREKTDYGGLATPIPSTVPKEEPDDGPPAAPEGDIP
jgi:hypothetical protein